jgi:hypothetical protein
MHYYFALQYDLSENLYISFSVDWDDDLNPLTPMNISLQRVQIIDILKTVLTNIDEDSEIGKTMSSLDGVNQVKELVSKLGLIDGNELDIKKVEMNIESIAPIVFNVLDFIADASIVFENDDTISFVKEMDLVSDDEVITTSSSINLKMIGDTSKVYVISINKMNVGSMKISGVINISEYEDDIVVDLSNVIALDGLEYLTEALFNSIENMKFMISGNLTMKMGSLSLADVTLEARVGYLDGSIQGYMKVVVPYKAGITNAKTTTYIYIQDGHVFMNRITEKILFTKASNTYRKNTFSGFMNNFMDNFIYIMNFTSTISNQFNNDSDFVIVEDQFLESYSYDEANQMFEIGIDLANGLSTSMFDTLTLKIGLEENDGVNYLRSFNGSVTMFKILSMSFDFQEQGCFGTEVDLSVIPSSLSTNDNYSYYNE